MNSFLEDKEWNPLAELLRAEVQEYGGLYNLLERQQSEIFQRNPEQVLKTNAEIEEYMGDMGELRLQREKVVSEMAVAFGLAKDESLSKILPYIPDFARPMFQALVDEVNQMVRRTRSKARQNFMLLSRTMELSHEALQAMQPDNYTKTYTKRGKVGIKSRVEPRYKAFV